MGGLSVALSSALSGLNINQQQLSILSQNIANANTQGYTRQIAKQQEVSLGGQGEGVSIEQVTRQVDQYLNQAVQSQNSTVGLTGVLNDFNNRIQLLIGQPGSNNSLDTFVSGFFNNLQALSQSPSNTALQNTVVNSGVTLASQTQNLAQGLGQLQFQADQDIQAGITTVNTDLQQLAQINTNITNAKSLGNSIASIQDQRDKLLNDVAQYIPINTYTKEDGSFNITTAGGVTLLDNQAYHLNYTPVGSASVFANNGLMSPITVTQIDAHGNPMGQPVVLVTSGPVDQVSSTLVNGKIGGLLQMRDQQIPDILSQLDSFSSTLRDQVNAVHNAGTSFPGAPSYTGERSVNAGDYSQWGGTVRLAVLGQDGQAIPSPYPDEPNGVAPLTLDMGSLNTGSGPGNPSVQGIINTINQYYGAPQNKAESGNLNNIQMVSDSAVLPGNPAQLNFDFNLTNLSANPSSFFVTNVQVTDSNDATVSTNSTPTPSVALASTGTYLTKAGSGTITIKTAGLQNNLINGEKVYLSNPGQSVDGISGASLTGFFTVSNVTSTSFDINISPTAFAGGTTDVSGVTATPPYAKSQPGQQTRTQSDGVVTADLSGNKTSPFYNVTATIAVDDGSGVPQSTQITYRINNQQSGLYGTQYSAVALSGSGTLVRPTSSAPLAVASLVDANGIELPKVNGQYVTNVQGFLKIAAGNTSNVVSIDSLDSIEQGQPNNNPAIPGTNANFSSYFALNNFFDSNKLTGTGDTVYGSAANLQVEKRIAVNPSLVSLGTLTRSPQPTDPLAPPNYTYESAVGDGSVVTKLAALGSAAVNFKAAGGLGNTQQSFNGYMTQVIGATSANASSAQSASTQAQTLMSGYQQQASSVSGVNLDTELANTVIYQNAYAASARVITVTNTLFDTLLQSFQ